LVEWLKIEKIKNIGLVEKTEVFKTSVFYPAKAIPQKTSDIITSDIRHILFGRENLHPYFFIILNRAIFTACR